jgi:hypothetical protein
MNSLLPRIFYTFVIAGIFTVQAQEKLLMEGTSIIGNKELPNVLYIVPWKSVERFDIETPATTSIMDQKLTPIDRASFRRKIHYHAAIFNKATSNASP